MNGEYKETLPSGKGEMRVMPHTWYIEYYFPGPDLRHNGTFLKISEGVLDSYISALRNNWSKYLELKEASEHLGGQLSVKGERNMTINCSGHFDGVCIDSYNMPMNTERKIENVISDWNWAKSRATTIMQLLKQMED